MTAKYRIPIFHQAGQCSSWSPAAPLLGFVGIIRPELLLSLLGFHFAVLECLRASRGDYTPVS